MKNNFWMASTFVLLASIAALFVFAITLQAEPVSAGDWCEDPSGIGRFEAAWCVANAPNMGIACSPDDAGNCYDYCIDACLYWDQECDWSWQSAAECATACYLEVERICLANP